MHQQQQQQTKGIIFVVTDHDSSTLCDPGNVDTARSKMFNLALNQNTATNEHKPQGKYFIETQILSFFL